MQTHLKNLLPELRDMGSNAAADALIERYPAGSDDYGNALEIIEHMSWSKQDQLKLARHYLSRLPFASRKPYAVFASIMSVNNILKILKEYMPSEEKKRSLFIYYAKPALESLKTSQSDRAMIDDFFSRLAS